MGGSRICIPHPVKAGNYVPLLRRIRDSVPPLEGV